MKNNTHTKDFDPAPRFGASNREMERLLAYEMSDVHAPRVTKAEPFVGQPDASSVLLQEARGTREMVVSEQFPADSDLEALKKIGIVVKGPSAGDPMFLDITLPAGWKKVPSREDSRTTHVVDDNGNVRAYAWYKAASYDRKAYGGVYRRFGMIHRYFNDYRLSVGWVVDEKKRESKRSIYETTERTFATDRECFNSGSEAATYKECAAWLDRNYPDWKDHAAYWDLEDPPTVGNMPSWDQKTR